eukprot:403362652
MTERKFKIFHKILPMLKFVAGISRIDQSSQKYFGQVQEMLDYNHNVLSPDHEMTKIDKMNSYGYIITDQKCNETQYSHLNRVTNQTTKQLNARKQLAVNPFSIEYKQLK